MSATGQRLAAVLHVDLVGFGALKEWNQQKAGSWTEALRNILGAEVPSGGGRLVTFAGEGSVAEFPSAGAALSAAERILQRVAARNGGQQPEDRFELSLGLDLGEVVDEAGELMGAPVKTALMASTLADPGGIAMTAAVHGQVKSQSALRGVFLRPVKFDYLPAPVRVFVVAPARAAWLPWMIRKRRLVPAFLAAALLGTVAVVGSAWWLSRPGEPVAAAAPPAAAAARNRLVVEGYESRDLISKYDGGGTTLNFTIDPAPGGGNELRLVTGGKAGWWGVVIAKQYDWSAYDTLVVPAHAAAGSAFRIMLKDSDDEPWTASFTASATGVIAMPFDQFRNTPDPKAPKDGRFDRARISQIQIMHVDPAGSDTIWIGPISVEGPAAPAAAPH